MRGIFICFCKPCDLGHNQSGAGYTIDDFVIAITGLDGASDPRAPSHSARSALERVGCTAGAVKSERVCQQRPTARVGGTRLLITSRFRGCWRAHSPRTVAHVTGADIEFSPVPGPIAGAGLPGLIWRAVAFSAGATP